MVLGLSERWGPHTLLPSLACLRQEEAGESCGFQTLPQNPQGPFGGAQLEARWSGLSLPPELLRSQVLHTKVPNKFCQKMGFCC